MDNLKWKWTDLMPGDKIKFNKKMIRHWLPGLGHEDKIFEIIRLEVMKNQINIYINNWVHSYIYIAFDGTSTSPS
jgi:hypothetical protein